MKYKEMHDISTILVEPSDKKSAVVHQVSMQKKPVIIVLPENASKVFQRPEDFGELKHIKRYLGTPITLVIMGSDRLKRWARRQGLSVYSSREALDKSLAQRNTEPLAQYQGVALPRTTTTSGRLKFSPPGTVPVKRRVRITEPLALSRQKIYPKTPRIKQWRIDSALLMLVLLLLVGIMGGMGFGYLLSLSHSMPAFVGM